MDNLRITLYNPEQAHTAIQGVWAAAKAELKVGKRVVLSLNPETRSTAQNSRLWAMLNDISKQVEWYGHRLTPEEWKDVFSASLKRSKVVPGIDGGFVVCGQSTSRMTVAEMCELQELMEAFGADRGLRFSGVQQAEGSR